MKKLTALAAVVAVAALLGGCVVVPYDGYYGHGHGGHGDFAQQVTIQPGEHRSRLRSGNGRLRRQRAAQCNGRNGRAASR